MRAVTKRAEEFRSDLLFRRGVLADDISFRLAAWKFVKLPLVTESPNDNQMTS